MKLYLNRATVIFFVIMITLCQLAIAGEKQSLDMVDGVNAIVNDKAITFCDVRKACAPAEKSLVQKAKAENISQEILIKRIRALRQEAARQLIERLLILEDFQLTGAVIPKEAIEEQLKRVRETSFRNDPAVMEAELKARGITLDEYRIQVEEELILSNMRTKNVTSLTDDKEERKKLEAAWIDQLQTRHYIFRY